MGTDTKNVSAAKHNNLIVAFIFKRMLEEQLPEMRKDNNIKKPGNDISATHITSLLLFFKKCLNRVNCDRSAIFRVYDAL